MNAFAHVKGSSQQAGSLASLAPSVKPVRDVASNRRTALIVEDDPSVSKLVRLVLAQLGFEVLQAGSASEAVAIWHQHHERITVLLIDVMLSGDMTASELVQLLRGRSSRTLQVIYTSGYPLELLELREELQPPFDFLPKPFSVDMLATLVANPRREI